jgi:hypothetical protein
VSFTEAKYILCLKIIDKKNFYEEEWKNAKILVEKKSVNIIDYMDINYVKIENQEFVVLMLEYANVGV